MEMIALISGTASSSGTVPTMTDPTARFTRPHASNENGSYDSVSLDILFTPLINLRALHHWLRWRSKKVQREPSKDWLYVYLDEAELHRMNVASRFYDVFFVIHLPDLEGIEGFHSWMWLNIDQLKPKRAMLIKRRVCDKPPFLLPLNLFQPLSEITKRNLNEPANTNTASTTLAAWKKHHCCYPIKPSKALSGC